MRARAAPAALLLAAVLLLSSCGQLSSAELGRGVATLESIGAEGALMADDVAHYRTKTTYVRVHAQELSDAAQHEAEKLNDAEVPERLRDPVIRAIEIAGDESDGLDSLRTTPDDQAAARDAEAKLRRTADAAKKLGDEL